MGLLIHANLLGFFVFGLFSGLIALVTTIFVIWMLIDAITNARFSGMEKLVWVLVILFLHFIGALVYYFVGRGGTTRSGPLA